MGNFVTCNEHITENLMVYVMGEDFTDEDVGFLNSLLKNTLEKHRNHNGGIHLHYSDNEYTYKDHMIHLLKDLKEFGFNFTEDIHHYEKHEELSLYYPTFLSRKINELLESKQKLNYKKSS